MYAVVEAGGRQYQLTSGRYVDVEMVAGEPQTQFVFERVLMIVNGEQSLVGKPTVDGAKVIGKIISHGRGPKIVVYKYRPKKRIRKRTGHHQGYTRIFINSINLNDKVLSEATDQGKPERKAKSAENEKTAARAPGKTSAKAGGKSEGKSKDATAKKAETKTSTKKKD